MQHGATAYPDVPLRSIRPKEIQAAEADGSRIDIVPGHRAADDALELVVGGGTDGLKESARRRRLLKRKPTPLERVRQDKRVALASALGDERLLERVWEEICPDRTQDYRTEDLRSVLSYLYEEFAEKERLSREQASYTPVSHAGKVSTV
ncbi:hypothetical protein FALCPG4_018461 [Fusarium falciforme]